MSKNTVRIKVEFPEILFSVKKVPHFDSKKDLNKKFCHGVIDYLNLKSITEFSPHHMGRDIARDLLEINKNDKDIYGRKCADSETYSRSEDEIIINGMLPGAMLSYQVINDKDEICNEENDISVDSLALQELRADKFPDTNEESAFMFEGSGIYFDIWRQHA